MIKDISRREGLGFLVDRVAIVENFGLDRSDAFQSEAYVGDTVNEC
jgi:hypothetical protein